MSPGILGKKIGMTQVFNADGQVVPVTLVKAGPCVVTQRKTPTNDGYDAMQLGLLEYAKEAATSPWRSTWRSREPRASSSCVSFTSDKATGDLKQGDRVLADEFKPKDVVDVIGTSKGRGFAGLVKRHHFRGGPARHGSMFHRAAGSIGASSFPSRVFPGMKMAGRMGTDQVTVRNLEIVSVDAEDNVIAVKGAIPGPNGGYVTVRRAKR